MLCQQVDRLRDLTCSDGRAREGLGDRHVERTGIAQDKTTIELGRCFVLVQPLPDFGLELNAEPIGLWVFAETDEPGFGRGPVLAADRELDL